MSNELDTPKESKKVVAGVLALFLGWLGVHKFYLGYTGAGVIQLILGLCTFGFTSLISIVEGVIYLTKSDEDFIKTYQVGKKAWF